MSENKERITEKIIFKKQDLVVKIVSKNGQGVSLKIEGTADISFDEAEDLQIAINRLTGLI